MDNSSKQAIDECMVKFKGRSTLKQYMPKKPIKRGFKIWARCDSKTGYLYQFEIYTGKGDSMEDEGLGYNVVIKLSTGLPENTMLAFDNFFTSCNLMDALYQKNIFAVGTVRVNRKDLPEIMKRSQPKHLRLEKGQFAAVTAEPITAIKWLDTRDVTILTTAHHPTDTVFVKRTQKDGTKKEVLIPKAIAQYTLTMGGVDHFDHFRSSYPISRKCRKFWMTVFLYV
ncbi:piggyBac transposable element-derived protein 4-like [Vanessa atalanta]|uniref:piggyBac transposable element-derived protein 4-like n=1 Tax=Vanessa atalanta TaxID=42275 RepID=UPI001FCD51DF|nr:piggyBac transposable element-derived protein 4-like [Vanessa atalanta]